MKYSLDVKEKTELERSGAESLDLGFFSTRLKCLYVVSVDVDSSFHFARKS